MILKSRIINLDVNIFNSTSICFRIELHMVGGFLDEKRVSLKLSEEIISKC